MGAVPPAPPPQPATGLSQSAGDIITSALRLINAIAVGETPTADEMNDGLMVLNEMLDVWQAERLMVNATQRQLFALKTGQQAYQMGPGAPDFNAPRPAKIDWFGIVTTQSPTEPLELPLWKYSESDWLLIPTKTITSTLPQGVWDDQGFPFRTLNFWPIPNDSSLQVAIYNWVALAQFPDTTKEFQFPPGYLRAIRYSLAIDLAAEFTAVLNPTVIATAAETKAVIRAMNAPSLAVRSDPALVSPRGAWYNYKTDNANLRT